MTKPVSRNVRQSLQTLRDAGVPAYLVIESLLEGSDEAGRPYLELAEVKALRAWVRKVPADTLGKILSLSGQAYPRALKSPMNGGFAWTLLFGAIPAEAPPAAAQEPRTLTAVTYNTDSAAWEVLKALRRREGIKGFEMAARMEISGSGLSKMETKHVPGFSTMARYAKALGYKLQFRLVKVPPRTEK